MNIFNLVNRGIKQSGLAERQARQAAEARASAVASARQQWQRALTADQVRAWMNVGTQDKQVLSGFASVLTLAGMAKVFDDRNTESVEIRIIRGAISAIEQCGRTADSVISAADARAFSAAAGHGIEIVKTCSDEAICHAAEYLHRVAGSGAQA